MTQAVQMMAILNVTPDSFSDGGRLTTQDALLRAAEEAVAYGATILDVGGESTRPGAEAVPVKEELSRVLPAIKALHQRFPQVKISIDTRKAAVADAAVAVGAGIINDVSGLQYDPAVAEVAARSGAQLVLMHSQGTPDVMQRDPHYPNGVVGDVKAFFLRQIERARQAGVQDAQLILDPGFGFGKTLNHNLTLLAHLDAFLPLGYPILVGLSRKSFLTLGDTRIPPAEREPASVAAMTLALERGARLIRVHDTRAHGAAIRLWTASRQATLTEPEMRY